MDRMHAQKRKGDPSRSAKEDEGIAITSLDEDEQTEDDVCTPKSPHEECETQEDSVLKEIRLVVNLAGKASSTIHRASYAVIRIAFTVEAITSARRALGSYPDLHAPHQCRDYSSSRTVPRQRGEHSLKAHGQGIPLAGDGWGKFGDPHGQHHRNVAHHRNVLRL